MNLVVSVVAFCNLLKLALLAQMDVIRALHQLPVPVVCLDLLRLVEVVLKHQPVPPISIGILLGFV